MEGNEAAFAYKLRIHQEVFTNALVGVIAVDEEKVEFVTLKNVAHYLQGLRKMRVLAEQEHRLPIADKFAHERLLQCAVHLAQQRKMKIKTDHRRPCRGKLRKDEESSTTIGADFHDVLAILFLDHLGEFKKF